MKIITSEFHIGHVVDVQWNSQASSTLSIKVSSLVSFPLSLVLSLTNTLVYYITSELRTTFI